MVSIAMPSQFAAPALQIRRADIVEHERAVLQMAPGQGPLDAVLLVAEPVQRGVDLPFFDDTQVQHAAQAGGRRLQPALARSPASSPAQSSGSRSSPVPDRARARRYGRAGAADQACASCRSPRRRDRMAKRAGFRTPPPAARRPHRPAAARADRRSPPTAAGPDWRAYASGPCSPRDSSPAKAPLAQTGRSEPRR